jgi:hypothetical protein
MCGTLFFGSACLLLTTGAVLAQIDHFDSYEYRLELNANPRVCEHMGRIYNQVFRQPWDYRDRESHKPFPKLAYVPPDSSPALNLSYSQHPTTAEFDRIPWKQGLGYFSYPPRPFPILIAQFDINNDGRDDLVIKHGFMLAPCSGGGSCPGGEDHIAVLDPGTVDLEKPLDIGLVIGRYVGKSATGSALSYDTLRYREHDVPKGHRAGDRMSARIIRPFVFDSKTYLSVYDAWAVDYPKRRRERMWVLEYQGGGNNPLAGDWNWAATRTLCRFRMVPTPTKR